MKYQGKNSEQYSPRVLDDILDSYLSYAGAVLIEGPRGCGKTRTALEASKSSVFLDDPAEQELFVLAPEVILDGEFPRLLDEWQLYPPVWNYVRRAVDLQQKAGCYILTGSAVPADDLTRHTGAGRFLRLQQRTMTSFERLLSSGSVSIKGLFAGERPVASTEQLSFSEVISHILGSGFPGWQNRDLQGQRTLMQGYVKEIVRTDLGRLADLRHSPAVLERLLRALARNACGELKYQTLAADLVQVAPTIQAETVANYLALLERLFVLERLEAWTPKLRSRARLRTTAKIQLLESAFVAVLLNATPEKLLKDTQTAGFIFESAAIHDLRVYAQAMGAEVYYYRDSNGKEVDAVIVCDDGRWGAVEVKLGAGQISAALKSLAAAIEDIDLELVGTPSFRLIVTGTGPTLTLADGTVTAPLTNLAP